MVQILSNPITCDREMVHEISFIIPVLLSTLSSSSLVVGHGDVDDDGGDGSSGWRSVTEILP